jgi:hypothetical protein
MKKREIRSTSRPPRARRLIARAPMADSTVR